MTTEVEVLMYIENLNEHVERMIAAGASTKATIAFWSLDKLQTDIGEVEFYLTASVWREDDGYFAWDLVAATGWDSKLKPFGKLVKLLPSVEAAILEYYDDASERDALEELISEEVASQEKDPRW